MVKARDFWQFICTKLGYKFFSGVPTAGLKPLYDTMNSEIMHYVPTVDDTISLGLVSGAFLSGYKGAILIAPDNIDNVMSQYKKFNEEFNIPTLFITNDLKKSVDLPVWQVEKDLSSLYEVDLYLYELKKGGSIINVSVE